MGRRNQMDYTIVIFKVWEIMFVLLAGAGVWNVVVQQRFERYLRENYREEWKELTTFLGYGPGISNPCKGFKFLYSDEDFGDEEIVRLKAEVKKANRYVLAALTGIIIASVLCIMDAAGA